MPTRILEVETKTYSATLGSTPQVQASQPLPNWGPVLGLLLDLTVSVTGATASQTSNSIASVLQRFAIDDLAGDNLQDDVGTDLPILLDLLSPKGIRVAAAGIATSGAGAGSAEWHVFLPTTIAAADMPGTLKVTLAPASALQNASFTSAGAVSVIFDVRLAVNAVADNPSLRVKIQNPPVTNAASGNALGPYFPAGLQVEALGFTLAGGDAEFVYFTLQHQRVTYINQSPLNSFVSLDVQLMNSGHLSGEFIVRAPVFVVDSTSYAVAALTGTVGASDLRLYALAITPQKERIG